MPVADHAKASDVVGPTHYVRVGVLGWVGRFAASDLVAYPRGCRVVCRTPRGLELGQILSRTDHACEPEGIVLRRMTVEDNLLAARLEKYRHEAFSACQEALRRRQSPAVLVDVEQLFDGTTIYFYFLGEIGEEVSELTDELGALYASRIEFARFHEALVHGCGPDCGTASATGCQSACVSCAVATACRKTRV